MKHAKSFLTFFWGTLLCAATAWCALQKDKAGNWVYPEFTFTAKKGDWEAARNWRDGRTPKGELPRVNILSGCTLTLSRPEAQTLSRLYLGLGGSQPTEIFFEKGAKLQTGGMCLPTVYLADLSASVRMSGGELVVGAPKEHGYFLDVGVGGTVSGTGHFEITGGTLSVLAGMRVGSSLSGTNVGIFCVSGSLPFVTVCGEGPSGLDIERWGTLEVVFGPEGVSTIDARKGQLRLHEGATIRVDARAYKGSAKNIPLVQMRELVKLGEPRFEVLPPPGFKGEAVLDKNRLSLKLSPVSR